MEFGLTVLALGGMYIYSNLTKDGSNVKPKLDRSAQMAANVRSAPFEEGFTTQLPNVNTPIQNYPIINRKEFADDVQSYPSHNSVTDQYFDQNAYQARINAGKKTGNEIQQIYSLSGEYIDTADFKHNNMVPFYGAKIRGQLYTDNLSESILDNMVGSGSQNIAKIEQAPLFKPHETMSYNGFGAPNQSDFMQSRVNPSMKMNNVKPFESQTVAPALGQSGGVDGIGGYNSGLDARELYMPKTIDEMRVLTNPKETFSLLGHEGPAQSQVKNRGNIGRVEKYTPDTFFINTQDRWLTTTGAEKGQRLIPVEMMHETNRNVEETPNFGVAGSTLKTASYIPAGHNEESKRIALGPLAVSHCGATGQHPLSNVVHDSHIAPLQNNRGMNQQPVNIGAAFIKSIFTPIMDILKPTRKEEQIDNLRAFGNMNGGITKSYVVNPDEVAPTTVRQTTLYAPNTFIQGQGRDVGAYAITNPIPIANQRDTTNCMTMGGVGGSLASNFGTIQTEAFYSGASTNDSKEILSTARVNQGGMQVFNQQMHVSTAKLESDRENNRMWVPGVVGGGSIPSLATYGHTDMQAEQNARNGMCDRTDSYILDQLKTNPYTFSMQKF